MINTASCPLCKAPMIIQKGARKSSPQKRYLTKKSHMYCSQCNRSAKEAMSAKLLVVDAIQPKNSR